MKTVDYVEIKAEAKEPKSELIKAEDSMLPGFSKEVPLASKFKESGDTVSIEYRWKEKNANFLKVKSIEFRNNEDIGSFYRANTYDGVDSASIIINGVTYIIRKTTAEVAKALYKATIKIIAPIETVIGHLKTTLGNSYIISKVGSIIWTVDKKLANGSIKLLSIEKLGSSHRKKLVEIIASAFIDLHKNRMLLKNFTLNNLLFTNDGAIITDLRSLRLSRKKSIMVEHFRKMLAVLFAKGIADNSDVYHATAMYCVSHESACEEWYSEKTGKRASDHFAIASELEKSVLE